MDEEEMLNDPEFSDNLLEQAIEQEIEFRGKIITYCVMIEEGLDRLLASYFCDDNAKASLLLHALLDHEVEMSKKIKAFGVILHNCGNKEIETKYLWLSEKMATLNERRNVVAHRLVSMDGVEYLRSRNLIFTSQTSKERVLRVDEKPITFDDIEEIEEQWIEIVTALDEMSKELRVSGEQKSTSSVQPESES